MFFFYFSTTHATPEPFTVNLTAACNFGCECHMSDVEPVCGMNGKFKNYSSLLYVNILLYLTTLLIL